MRKLLCVAGIALPIFCQAQDVSRLLIHSGKAINEGVKLHDEQKYPEAIAKYKLVSRSDTNYAWALSELALTYIMQQEYNKAIAVAKEGLSLRSSMELNFFLRLGNAYDDAKKHQEALVTFEEGLKKYPYSYQLNYEKGVSLVRQEKTAEAAQAFQRAIELNFFHVGSHRALGNLCLQNGNQAQGMLSQLTYLILDPDSENSRNSIVFLEEMTTGDAKPTIQKVINSSNPDDFAELNRIIKSKVALNEQYAFQTKMRYKVVKQVQVLLEKLKHNPQSSDFWMQQYGQIYTQLWSNGLFEPFTYYVLATIDEKAAQKFKKDDSDIKKFREWAREAFRTHNNFKKITLNGSPQTYRFFFHDNSRPKAIIEKYDEKKDVLAGYSEFYYSSGGLRSKGVYNTEGKKIGEWQYYYENGGLSQIERYQSPDENFTYQSFYANGSLKEEATYLNGKVEGVVKDYTAAGAKIFEGDFKNSQKQGRSILYYPSGMLQLEGTFAASQQDGPYKNYYPDGRLKEEGALRQGKENGLYRAYHPNGKIETEGTIGNGVSEGGWKWYHANGKIYKTGQYKEGKEQGAWKLYFEDGIPQQELSYINGQLQGLAKVYDTDGKLHFEYQYHNGKLKGYTYYDKSGKVISEATQKGSILRFVSKYPHGGNDAEGNMVDGKNEGLWKSYLESGTLFSETTYKADQPEGTVKLYYPQGTVAIEKNYKAGQLDGLYRHYHHNGKAYTEGYYVAGVKQGEWNYYYINGQLKEKTYYLNDTQTGYQELFHPDGRKYQEVHREEGIVDRISQADTAGKIYQEVAVKQGNGAMQLTHLNGKASQTFIYKYGEKDGESKEFYANGKLKSLAFYRFQEAHGPSSTYFENGKIWTQAYYKMGLQDSLAQYFDEEGRLASTFFRKNGKTEGVIRWYHPNGKIETEGFEKDDEREGYCTYYAPDGTPQYRINYHHGLIIGYSHQNASGQWLPDVEVKEGTAKMQTYYPNGKLSYEGSFEKNKRHGLQKYYTPEGTLLSEKNLLYGVVHGEVKEYYANGNLKRVENYYYDSKDGVSKEYNDKGILVKETPYLIDLKHGIRKEYNAGGKLIKNRKFVYDESYE